MSAVQQFTVTEKHIKLLRNMNVSWEDTEFGAPCIDPKRPYGNSNVYADMVRIIHDVPTDEDDMVSDKLANNLYRLHKETQTALQIFLATGAIEPGDYEAPAYTRQWRKV